MPSVVIRTNENMPVSTNQIGIYCKRKTTLVEPMLARALITETHLADFYYIVRLVVFEPMAVHLAHWRVGAC